MSWKRWAVGGLISALAAGGASAQQPFQDPQLPTGQTRQVSPHVWVIMGFPNIGIVVGDDAVLVVDTGLGAANGELITQEAKKLAKRGQEIILTTTHFHPEHTSGQSGFPPRTQVIRNQAQQQELEAEGQEIIDRFAKRSPEMRNLLKDAKPQKATTLFDREATLDLGQVHAKLYWFGAAHTRGDEIIYIPEDKLLLPGDVVQNRLSPNVICASCSPRQWVAVLDKVAELKPERVVPDHGELGSGALVAQERAFLVDLDQRAVALKTQGVPVDDAGKRIQADMEKAYPSWQGLGNVPQSVARAYSDPR